MAFLAALLFKPSKPAAPKITLQQAQPPAAPPPPAPPPTPETLEEDAGEGAAAEARRVKRRRGQASTILTSPLGVTSAPPAPATLGGY